MRHSLSHLFTLISSLLAIVSCSGGGHTSGHMSGEAQFLSVIEKADGIYEIVSISPFDGHADTLVVGHPMERLVTMSTSYIGFLDAIGCDSIVCGVSGLDFVSSPSVQALSDSGRIFEIGYDAAPDYERIVSLHPDLLLTYSVSSAKSQFVSRLESLGIPVFYVHEHLETDPLARASYIRLFGALAGNMAAADSVFNEVKDDYQALVAAVEEKAVQRRKVLVNIPYNDQWFIPGAENYVSRFIHDAGGEILGSVEGETTSSTISIERAYSLSQEADIWLNVSWCNSLGQLLGVNPLFKDMLDNIDRNSEGRGFDGPLVWNDNLRTSAKGGNDIWESGVVRPDLVLKDLVHAMHPEVESGSTVYYRPLE